MIKIRNLAIAWLGLLVALPCLASAQESFYQGKTIRMIVGTSAGGALDDMARMLTATTALPIQNVPLAQSLVKTDEARQLLQAGVQDPADFYVLSRRQEGQPRYRADYRPGDGQDCRGNLQAQPSLNGQAQEHFESNLDRCRQ